MLHKLSALSFLLAVSLSAATVLPVGFVSVDPMGTGANTITFDITNQTGVNASLYPDTTFPVTTPLVFSNISLLLNFGNGGTLTEGPSQFIPDGSGGFTGNFVFNLSSFPIANATLTGTLGPLTVQLNDGISQAFINPAFSATVLPNSGRVLQAGDFGLIGATTVPEPGSWALLGAGLTALLLVKRRVSKRAVQTGILLPVLMIAASQRSWTQVRLNAAAQPAVGYAGVTVENLTGAGFPAGGISPASITVSLSTACNAAAIGTARAVDIAVLPGTNRRIAFAIPATIIPGSYFVSVTGATDGGTSFNTGGCAALTVQAQDTFVHSVNGQLTLDGFPFRVGGGNSYVLMYSPKATVDQLLQTAVNNQLKVIRTWAFIDIGNADGSNSVRGKANGFYFQYWDGNEPAYNDGSTGLANLDYTIYRAGQLGLKLIIPFTNNWIDFGGMDQYVRWAGGSYHDSFYTDPKIRQWYKNWISHLLNHVNIYNGLVYKDDPTIIMWELANEPRCTGSGRSGGGYPSTSACTTQTITDWVADVSLYVKSVDSHHLVSVGDEGFFCDASAGTWIENCSQGVDSVAFAQLPGIDAMGFHLYPEGWGQTMAWSQNYVDRHLSAAQTLGKPAYLGEFGLMAGNTRNATYFDWTNRMLNGGSGALFWDLISGEPGPAAEESNNSFDLADGGPLLTTMKNFSQMIGANTPLPFAPVADNQWATTPFNQAVTLNPFGNDIAYAGAAIDPSTIDLNPGTPGIQNSVTVYGGTFSSAGAGGVQFTPANGFNGTAQGAYTVEDTNHNLSNIAYLSVTVNPSTTGSLTIESFETGTDGWAPLSADAGTVAQSSMYHTDGNYSLQVNATGGGWFGVTFASSLDLSGRPTLSLDVESTGMSSSVAIAFQSGSNYTWCQTQDPWPTVGTNTSTTVSIPLDGAHLNCGGGTPDFTNIHTVFIYFNGPGTFYVDNVRAAAPTNSSTPLILQSFETGTAAWGPLNGATHGSVAQTSTFHTDGAYGLQIYSTDPGGNGDWFGVNLSTALNLAGRTSLKIDVGALDAGTGTNIAIQAGSNYTWCQGPQFPYVAAGSSSTVSIDLTNLSCGTPDLSQVHAIWIYCNVGTFDIDNVRVQ